MVYLYKNNLHRGISVYKSNFAGAIWLKLNIGYFFSLNEDLYIACIYIAPYNSSSTENDADSDVFQILLDEIACYNTLGNIMLIGDMNSRTGQMKESLFSNSAAINMFDINQNDKNYNKYEDFCLPTKVSKDDSVNTNGHKLMELLATCNMYILLMDVHWEIFKVTLHCPIHICIKTNHFKSNNNNTILTNSQSNLPTKSGM